MSPGVVFGLSALLLAVSVVSFFFFIKINRKNKLEFDKKLKRYNQDMEIIRQQEESRIKEEQKKEQKKIKESQQIRPPVDRTEYYPRRVQFMSPSGASYDVPLQDSFTIGKNPNCDLCVKDPSVGAMHCKILYSEGKYLIQDLGSGIGTYFDGILIPANSVQEIRTGVLQFGKVTFFVTIDSE